MLVQQHPHQQGQRVASEQVVGGGVSGDVQGHVRQSQPEVGERCVVPAERTAHLFGGYWREVSIG